MTGYRVMGYMQVWQKVSYGVKIKGVIQVIDTVANHNPNLTNHILPAFTSAFLHVHILPKNVIHLSKLKLVLKHFNSETM